MSDYNMLFKFIMIGDSSVGKSCMLMRMVQGRFNNQHEPTLGVQFGSKIFNVKNKKIKVQVWDTAGQEAFGSITRAYYKGSIGVLLVFDLTSIESFQNIKKWMNELKIYSHQKIQLSLVGNKVDLTSSRQVSQQEIKQFLKKHSIERYFETSALNGTNIEAPFFTLAHHVLEILQTGEIKPEQYASMGIKIKDNIGLKPHIIINQPCESYHHVENNRCNC